MALSAEDVLYPNGDLDPVDFPGRALEDLEEDIEGWLEAAYAMPRVVALSDEAGQDAAAKLWAEYRGFAAVCRRVSREPAQAELKDQGSRTFAPDQRNNFCSMATAKLAAFEQVAPVVVALISSGSRSVRTTTVW